MIQGFASLTWRVIIRLTIKNCYIGQRGKVVKYSHFRTLRPVSLSERPWADISVDLVTDLPWSNGFDTVYVVVDWLTNMRHLIPCCSTIDASEFVKLFIRQVFKLHGLPDIVISDRGPQFVENSRGPLCKRLQMERRLSRVYYPQPDGPTE